MYENNTFGLLRWFFTPVKLYTLFAAGTWVAVGTAAVGAYSANQSARAQNRASKQNAKLTREEAQRRYAFETGIAEQQMEEQRSLAMEQMTDISRAFISQVGQAKAVQAETGVSGVSAQRAKALDRTKASEAKGQVAKEIDTNVINIANGMLANKIDTEAILAKAQANKTNVGLATLNGAVSGFATGMSMSSSFNTKGVGSASNAGSDVSQYDTFIYPNNKHITRL